MNKAASILLTSILFLVLHGTSFSQNISDEARLHFDRGGAAVEMAKSPGDYDVAIKEFKQAIDLAPDWADAYYNLGNVRAQAEKFADAVASFKQYLRLAPNASDVASVKSLINKLEYKAENTLTKADIISVLTSLSKWEVKGEGDHDVMIDFRQFTSKDEGLINVPMCGGFSPPCSPASYQTLKVEGPTVKFRWARYPCAPNLVPGDCSHIREVEIEVLSKTRVKIRQVIVSAGFVFTDGTWGQLAKPGIRYEWELSAPK